MYIYLHTCTHMHTDVFRGTCTHLRIHKDTIHTHIMAQAHRATQVWATQRQFNTQWTSAYRCDKGTQCYVYLHMHTHRPIEKGQPGKPSGQGLLLSEQAGRPTGCELDAGVSGGGRQRALEALNRPSRVRGVGRVWNAPIC